MQARWVLSQFQIDDEGHRVPVAADYGGMWAAPIQPSTEDGWALTQVYLNSHQIDAMASDDRVLVCPLLLDPRPINDLLVKTFQGSGATETMSFSLLLALLSDMVQLFGHDL